MMFLNLFDHFKKKVHRIAKEIRELMDDLQSRDEKISKFGIENAELIEKSKLKDKEIEELKKQLQMGSKLDIPKKQNLPKTSVKKSDKPNSLFKSPDFKSPQQIRVEWTEFEFITEKKGAYGPSKAECTQYYIEK